MSKKQTEWIKLLLSALDDESRPLYHDIAMYLFEMGYVPQKQSVSDFVLAFKHRENGKVIAKMGFRKQKGFLSVKFFACKDVPEKFIAALRIEADANEDKYSNPAPPHDHHTIPSDEIMKKCTLQCSVCTGGGMRYFYVYPDGKEIFRCGAYPVLLPNITRADLCDLKRLLSEQHNYFLSLVRQKELTP